jgi:hypothetical protein
MSDEGMSGAEEGGLRLAAGQGGGGIERRAKSGELSAGVSNVCGQNRSESQIACYRRIMIGIGHQIW